MRLEVVPIGDVLAVDAVGIEIVGGKNQGPALEAVGEALHDGHGAGRRLPAEVLELMVHLGFGGAIRAGDETGNRGRGHHRRAGEIGLGVRRAHTALEVPVGRRNADLTGLEQAGAEADASAASRRERPCASLEENVPDTLSLGLVLDLCGGGRDVELDTIGHLGALEHLGGCRQVIETAIRTGKQVGLVDRDLLFFNRRDRLGDADAVRSGNVGGDRAEVNSNFGGVLSIRIRFWRVGLPLVDHGLGQAVQDPSLGQTLGSFSEEGRCCTVEWEPPDEGAPLGCHVRDGQAFGHRKELHAVTMELDCGVENLARVEEAAQRNDDVLAGDARFEFTLENDLDRTRYLPPGGAGRPQCSSVGSHDRRADRRKGAVHVGVRIGGDHQAAGVYEALVDHQLVSDPGAGGVEYDSLLSSKILDRLVLLEVFFTAVLDGMIECKYRLVRVGDCSGADRRELWHHRTGIVVGHDVERADRDHVAGAHFGAFAEVDSMGLDDFFGDGL